MNRAAPPPPAAEGEILAALRRAGVLGDAETARFEALTGGVSSDIWKVAAGARVFCVKRARARLKVDAVWHAPVERNRFEVAWCEIASRIVPGAAPRILAEDRDAMLFAMDYLDPATHKLWKTELRDGRAEPAQAAEIGRMLARIHAGTAGEAAIAARFPRSDIFDAIRLEPYLEATATRHPDLADALFALSRRTRNTRLAMIHGDVSPKNILIGPDGPVFLDAECACIGDPAFDLAFCLNHFLLKCLWRPDHRPDYFACFGAMVAGYVAGVTWEPPEVLETRAARLLPGLFLGRVDGKSPVEYLEREIDRDRVRRCAGRLLTAPPETLAEVLEAWKEELGA